MHIPQFHLVRIHRGSGVVRPVRAYHAFEASRPLIYFRRICALRGQTFSRSRQIVASPQPAQVQDQPDDKQIVHLPGIELGSSSSSGLQDTGEPLPVGTPIRTHNSCLCETFKNRTRILWRQ